MRIVILLFVFVLLHRFSFAQNVGIGATSPVARLHVADSNVVFTGPVSVQSTTIFSPPVQGPGSRMMWYPQKGAFRAGAVTGLQWDKENIGRFSFASGINCIAKGDGSLAMGVDATAEQNGSAAIGWGVKAKTSSGFVTGQYNDTTSSASLFAIGNGSADNFRRNAVIVTYNGYTGFGITPRKKIDIFIAASGSSYHPNTSLGIESNTNHYINLITNDNSETGILFGNGLSYADGGITYTPAGAAVNPRSMYFRTANTTPMILYNNGNMALAGNLFQNSDAGLKKNIVPLANALSSLRQLHGYTYNWKDEKGDSTQQIGLIAQELQKLYPQLVKQNTDGNLSVNYIGLVPVLLESIKELAGRNEKLEDAVKKLQQK